MPRSLGLLNGSWSLWTSPSGRNIRGLMHIATTSPIAKTSAKPRATNKKVISLSNMFDLQHLSNLVGLSSIKFCNRIRYAPRENLKHCMYMVPLDHCCQ